MLADKQELVDTLHKGTKVSNALPLSLADALSLTFPLSKAITSDLAATR